MTLSPPVERGRRRDARTLQSARLSRSLGTPPPGRRPHDARPRGTTAFLATGTVPMQSILAPFLRPRRVLLVTLALLAGGPSAAAADTPAARDATGCFQSRWLNRHVCEPAVISKVPYASLKQSLSRYIDEQKRAGTLTEAGIYFRDLEDGPHFGVNEYASFAAASLLKLPLVIQYLMLAEDDPGLLQLRLSVPEDAGPMYAIAYPSPEPLEPGRTYTIEDLLRRTVAHSDNVAFLLLNQYLVQRYGGEDFILESYRQLGLVPEFGRSDYVISVARYAALFKLVYQAAFLNADSSDKLVRMLQQSSFKAGLERGVPAAVKVAHKFGERGLGDPGSTDGLRQLHDCGIVYFPGNPYTLCVMTQGHDYAQLERVIAEISRRVYQEVDARRGRRGATR